MDLCVSQSADRHPPLLPGRSQLHPDGCIIRLDAPSCPTGPGDVIKQVYFKTLPTALLETGR